MNNAPDIKYLRHMAKARKIPWEFFDLPRGLKDQCIAYSIREGSTFRVGRPSRNAIIFVFPDGTVYDISLLIHAGYCWRKVSAVNLKWIKERKMAAFIKRSGG